MSRPITVLPGMTFDNGLEVIKRLGRQDDGFYYLLVKCPQGHRQRVMQHVAYQVRECPRCYRERLDTKKKEDRERCKKRDRLEKAKSKAVKLYKSGLSLAETASKSGISPVTVRTAVATSCGEDCIRTSQRVYSNGAVVKLRNEMIRDLIAAGWGNADLTSVFGLTRQRLHSLKRTGHKR